MKIKILKENWTSPSFGQKAQATVHRRNSIEWDPTD